MQSSLTLWGILTLFDPMFDPGNEGAYGPYFGRWMRVQYIAAAIKITGADERLRALMQLGVIEALGELSMCLQTVAPVAISSRARSTT